MSEFVRPSDIEDAFILGPNLREEDKYEAEAGMRMDTASALGFGINVSTPCYTFLNFEGEPEGIFGVVPYAEDGEGIRIGRVWMMAGKNIREHPITFLKRCKPWLNKFYEEYDILFNWVNSKNTERIKWLEWMGFILTGESSYLIDDELYLKFIGVR